MRTEAVSATVRVKGGMPLDVEGLRVEGGGYSDEPGWCEIDVEALYWPGSMRRVTEKFKDSLTVQDWSAIHDGLAEAGR